MFLDCRRWFRNSARELKEALATLGFLRTCTVIGVRLTDGLLDRWYGFGTARRIPLDDLEIDSENKERGGAYQPTSVPAFRTLLRGLPLPRGAGFVDYGCGMGRVLLLAAAAGFRRVVGVEFSPKLCEIARANALRYRASRPSLPPIEIVEADASRYVPAPDIGIFYFFNPFDELLMRQAVDRILDSLRRSPREAWLLYNEPCHRVAVDAHPEFVLDRELFAGGHACRIYRYAPRFSSEVPHGNSPD